jgi:hypothetical protein
MRGGDTPRPDPGVVLVLAIGDIPSVGSEKTACSAGQGVTRVDQPRSIPSVDSESHLSQETARRVGINLRGKAFMTRYDRGSIKTDVVPVR